MGDQALMERAEGFGGGNGIGLAGDHWGSAEQSARPISFRGMVVDELIFVVCKWKELGRRC